MWFRRLYILLPLLALLAMSALSACRQTAAPPATGVLAPTPAGFVGSDACISCHPNECSLHRDGRHAGAMHAAQPAALGALAPPLGAVPMAGYRLDVRDGQLALTRSLPPTGPIRLDLVLGSGKVGLTFVSIQDADTLLETHMSYFPEGKQWDYTPGHEIRQKDDGVFGRVQHNPDARRCLGCHSVTLPEQTLAPEPRFYGVGCEACHGPGLKHIRAMQQASSASGHAVEHAIEHSGSTIGMEALQRLPSQQLNDLCGKCHRALKDVDVQSAAGAQTHRFQPYALTRSRCRNADGSVLSCLTCHTPHDNVSTDLHAYEQTCLKCHSAPTASTTVSPASPVSKTTSSKPCPVNSKTGCIHCHMRDRQAFPGLFWKPMVDHLISIPARSPATSAAHSAAKEH